MSTTAYPPSPFLRAIRFWLSFLAGLIGFSIILLLGGYTFRGSFTLQLTAYIFALLVAISWLVWRWFIWRDHLPRTGLEIPIGLGLLAVLISLAASPDIRQGLWRTGWIIGYALIFYILLNLLDTDLDRWGLLASAATVTGLALFQADVETLQWYRSWWEASGGFSLPPFPYRFIGLLNLSTPLMAIANQFLPLVLLAVWRLRRPFPRVLALVWVIIYFLAVPFSSSRAGWIGMAAALTVALGFWLYETRPWRIFTGWARQTQWMAVLGVIVIVVLAAIFASRFIVAFATHPSHGSDPFSTSGRNVFWENAVKIWQLSPLFGAGPGRFAFDYLRVEPSIPPGFWPWHAHNNFFEVLAEFGGLGLAAWLLMLGTLILWGWRRYRQSAPFNRPWTAAILAGLSGLLAQFLFDDLTFWMAVIVPAVFLLAYIGCDHPKTMPVYRQVSVGWLAVPCILLLAVAGWELWGYQPFSQWIQPAQAGDWRQAAELASQSAERDPFFHFYHTEAGLLWAWEWNYRQDPAALAEARRQLTTALQLEPSTSWTWANLAILDADAGDTTQAILHLQQAVHFSPDFSIYEFNLGKLFEQTGQSGPAVDHYRKALDLNPSWAIAKYWSETPLRKTILSEWAPPLTEPVDDAQWQLARSQISAGDLDSAEKSLAKAELLFESNLDIARTRLLLAKARADSIAIQTAQAQVDRLANQLLMMVDPDVDLSYSGHISNRDGIGFMAVPGLIPQMDE